MSGAFSTGGIPAMLDLLYRESARAGFLLECVWTSADGAMSDTRMVKFGAPDEVVMSGFATLGEPGITFPTHWFVGLKAGDDVIVKGQSWKVNNSPKTFGDGSETYAPLRKANG